MKKLTKVASGVLALGVLMATGITAFAATDTPTNTDTNSSNTAISEESVNRRSMKRGRTGFGNMERPELTEDQKTQITENMKKRMDEQLKDGNITQEQYDQALSNIEEGKRPMNLGNGNGNGNGRKANGNIERPELTEDQKAQMTENMKERIDQQLKDGNITQEQYDQALSNIEEGKRPMNLANGNGHGRKGRANRGQGGLCHIERPEVTDQ